MVSEVAATAKKLDKLVWLAAALVALDCALRIAVLAYWLFAPERAPDIPVFTKGMRYPQVQAGVLLVTLPMLAALAWPRFLSPRRHLALGVTLTVVGFALFILGGVFLSFNVVSGWAHIALGQAMGYVGAVRRRRPG
ncbi:hypothetical protein ACG04R_13185 [Roseateles sp. BYS78W]|uniref:Uncharacterized protein n=1 Tax=Pelomonas candidula TaxID=3299025 RepID=A0ABW7HCS2_9BURK